MLGVIAVAMSALVVTGIAESDFRRIATGDCGYFSRASRGADQWERRPCDHPEAVLIVTQAPSKQKCAVGDSPFGKSGRRKSWCTQLNVAVGECVNDPKNVNAWLNRLRKVPCAAGAFVVDTRVAARDPRVCATSAKTFAVTEAITYARPPVSYCLHRI
ncbi:hypothetical protein [Nocardia sp. AG03]|uniref:hypothetical protein n=1 Tax=Nocardia sp. AG03 TaxID=3025312 RepID=UPI0024181F16|nr:hypothetical protein [Nocardia sp. AG03]